MKHTRAYSKMELSLNLLAAAWVTSGLYVAITAL